MTRSHEKGRNEFTEAAKREAMQCGVSPEEILERWLAEAKQAGETARRNKLVQALKFVRTRNQQKRRGRK